MIFKILRGPYAIFNDLCGHTLFNENYLNNVSFPRHFYQCWFINEYFRKKKLKSGSPRVKEFFSVIKNNLLS